MLNDVPILAVHFCRVFVAHLRMKRMFKTSNVKTSIRRLHSAVGASNFF